MLDTHTLAMKLARGNKRVKFWKQHLTENTLNEEMAAEAAELLGTYALLLSKLDTTTDEAEIEETIGRIGTLERQLEESCAHTRLLPSKFTT